jgi:hypothetical protein
VIRVAEDDDFRRELDEVRRALDTLIKGKQWGDLPPELSPLARPSDRYAHLPQEVRDWFDSLRKDDIETLKETMQFQRSTKTIGKFLRYSIGVLVTTFIGAVMFGEKAAEAWKWFIGGSK